MPWGLTRSQILQRRCFNENILKRKLSKMKQSSSLTKYHYKRFFISNCRLNKYLPRTMKSGIRHYSVIEDSSSYHTVVQNIFKRVKRNHIDPAFLLVQKKLITSSVLQ